MGEAERTLGRRELNRALLARQCLLERSRSSLPRTLERVGGLQAQYAPSMYIGLWSRMEGFTRDQLTRALERRTVAQGTLMRITIHLVAARDWWPFAVAVRGARREAWLSRHPDLSATEMVPAARRLRSLLAAGPLRRAEIEERLGLRAKPGTAARFGGVGQWLDMVRVPPSGTWERRRADLYAAAEDWLGPENVSAEDAIDRLVGSYLRGFGPASRKDIADYCGLPAKAIGPALERMRLRRFRSEDGAELLDVPRAPLPAPDTPAPVRFLPTWDATLLAHARRTGILPEEHRPRVFNTKTPHSAATFLVDGMVAGAWRWESGRIELDPFRRLDSRTRRALRAEAEGLAQLHA